MMQERRNGDIAYLPVALSIRVQVERFQKRKPGILTSSEEWVRLQFCLENPQNKSSFKHMVDSTLNIWFNGDKCKVSILIQNTLMCTTYT